MIKDTNDRAAFTAGENLELIAKLRSVDCELLHSPYKAKFGLYYFCTCDPDHKEPICEKCYMKCHERHNNQSKSNETPVTETIIAMCHCGMICHVISEAGVPKDNFYQPQCLFMEWSSVSKLNTCYKIPGGNKVLCMLCYNFCEKSDDRQKLERSTFQDTDKLKCSCQNFKFHEDIRNLINAVLELKNLSNFNFDSLTPVQLFNLVLMSQESYLNLYQSFDVYLKGLQQDIEKDSLNVDPNIGHSIMLKSLANFTALASSCKNLFYFCDNMDWILFHQNGFILKFLEKKCDVKTGKHILSLKLMILNLYYKIIFKRDFENLPKFSVKDIENLNPFQRLLNSDVYDKSKNLQFYFNNQKKPYLDSILNIIEKMKNLKEKNETCYEILRLLYSICKTFARFNKFSTEQRLKYFSLNDEIIFSSYNRKSELSACNSLSQMKMLSAMVKSILFLAYNYNDEQLSKYLMSKENPSTIAFLHSHSEVGKLICKNCTNILNCVRILKQENYSAGATMTSNFLLNCKPRVLNTAPEGPSKAVIIKNIEKYSRKTIFYATDITSISINYPDTYLIGLRRLIFKSKEIYVNYLNNTLSSHEENALRIFRDLSNQLEQTYSDFFMFKCKEKDVKNAALHCIKSFFEVLGMEGYNPPIKDYASEIGIDGEQSKFLIQEANSKKILFLKNQNYGDDSNRKSIGKDNASNSNSENVNPSSKMRDVKYRILINKTAFFFSLIKSLKILLTAGKYKFKDSPENFSVDDNYLEEMVNFIYFYIEDNPDNGMLFLTKKVINAFLELNKKQVSVFIDLVHHILHNFKKINFHLSSHKVILTMVNNLILKLSKDPAHIEQVETILRIIKMLTEIHFINQDDTYNSLRKIIKTFYELNPILAEFKNFLKAQATFAEVPQGVGKGKEENVAVKISNVMNKTKKILDEKSLNGYYISSLFIVYTKFLNIVNIIFDGNATLNESKFLSEIVTNMEIPQIISKKDLSLSLRIELLKFFRLVYIDVLIDRGKMDEYISLFVNPIHINEERGQYEDGTKYKFFQDLINITQPGRNISIESAVLKFELKNFSKVIECNKNENSSRIREYFENGIILPIHVFLSKFMSIIYNLNGREYINLYEIVVYFLKLKKFLLSNKTKIEKISQYTFENIFKSFLLTRNSKYSLINFGINEDDLKAVGADIEEMSKINFEILNYKTVFSYFEKHFHGFITKPESSFLKELFLKKDEHYSEDEVKNKEKEWKQVGYLKSYFEKRIWDIVLKYENDKAKFQESSLVQNLPEQNIQYDANYRSIILRSMFYMINDNRFLTKSRRQNLWHIFKLLQYDTGETQKEILSLMKQDAEKGSKEAKTVDLERIVNLFLENLLSLIFASCNPSCTVMNEDYFIALTVIKILKYMCEDHNTEFQRIFFQEMKFEYTDKEGNMMNISVFDLMLGILGKICILAKWDQVKFGADENSISYFYDIFFVIVEFCIEMVQGTEEENLEEVRKIPKGEDVSHFYRFLAGVKSLVMNTQNDSLILYQVRKDLIDFIVAFLEEKSTPPKLIDQITSIYNPLSVFGSIVNTLKILYIKATYKGNNKDKIKEYTNTIFDHKMCDYFMKCYFSDVEFCKSPEFELANRMYQYVKLLAVSFKNDDASNLINSIKIYPEKKLIDIYTRKNKLRSEIFYNDENSADVVLDKIFFQNYFVVKFFEAITRCVFVQRDGEDVRVLMNINPLVPYLSMNSKNEFFNKVDRENRYTKLYSLIEYSSYFFDEIQYNKKRANNWFLQKINMIKYYYVEAAMFLITSVINLMMVSVLRADDLDNELEYVFGAIQGLGLAQISMNALFLIFWIISKFHFYFLIETKKYEERKKKNKNNEPLTFLEYLSIIFLHTILYKNEINGLCWNIILSSVAISSIQNIFLFSIELLIIINLSKTLKNIIKAVTMRSRQLIATGIFIVIMLYVFACMAFFFLSEDFVNTIETNQENQCGTLLYCFLTHLDYGLRTDGGIGEHLLKTTWNHSPGYFVGRFFYELLFFMVIIIILLSIVGGIIIDTFAELREELTKIDEDMLNKCYICGGERDEIEKECENYETHINEVHHIWTYVYYMIGLMFVDKQETNAINSYVIEKIESKKISWFPAYKNKEEEEEEEEGEGEGGHH